MKQTAFLLGFLALLFAAGAVADLEDATPTRVVLGLLRLATMLFLAAEAFRQWRTARVMRAATPHPPDSRLLVAVASEDVDVGQLCELVFDSKGRTTVRPAR